MSPGGFLIWLRLASHGIARAQGGCWSDFIGTFTHLVAQMVGFSTCHMGQRPFHRRASPADLHMAGR